MGAWISLTHQPGFNASTMLLVRLRNNASGDIVYCRTQNHSSMGVATGSVVQNTRFTVPPGIGLGASTLQVVANGIASSPLAVTIVQAISSRQKLDAPGSPDAICRWL